MNTMKKEDMEKEQQLLVTHIGRIVIQSLNPLAQVLGAIGRITFLQSEIDKVTPKPEVKHDQVAS